MKGTGGKGVGGLIIYIYLHAKGQRITQDKSLKVEEKEP